MATSLPGIAAAYGAITGNGFGDWDIRTMLMIAGAESSYNPTAISSTNDYGVWQINSHYWPQLFREYDWTDVVQNNKMAHVVWKAQGNSGWSTYKSGAYLRYGTYVDTFLAGKGTVPAPPSGTGGNVPPAPAGNDGGASWFNGLGNRFIQHGNKIVSLNQQLRDM